jgi:membrane associated rhomboid family serine protease
MIPVNALIPIRKRAYVTYGLILLNILVFVWQTAQPVLSLNTLFKDYAAVMCLVARAPFAPETLLDILRSMFFHGGWLHLIGNMTFLWVFGRPVEGYFGSRRFALFYLAAGFAAAYAETLVNGVLCVPLIGASGAIAGVLGSYLLLYPGSRIRTQVFIFRFDLSAILILGYWFLVQLFNGVASLGAETVGGGVAFFAHIAGFVAGMVFAFLHTITNPPPERFTYVD